MKGDLESCIFENMKIEDYSYRNKFIKFIDFIIIKILNNIIGIEYIIYQRISRRLKLK
jgi:hypothetical protein